MACDDAVSEHEAHATSDEQEIDCKPSRGQRLWLGLGLGLGVLLSARLQQFAYQGQNRDYIRVRVIATGQGGGYKRVRVDVTIGSRSRSGVRELPRRACHNSCDTGSNESPTKRSLVQQD